MVMGDMETSTDLLVIGSGPGGFAAATRGADLGLDVILVDKAPELGGTWLHHGCIPAKSLLHITEVISEAANAAQFGLHFNKPRIDLDQTRKWLQETIDSLTQQLIQLAKEKDILLLQAQCRFIDSSTVQLTGSDINRIRFKHAIIATGSKPALSKELSHIDVSRTMSSTSLASLTEIPKSLLVVGSNYIGLELASIFAILGSEVTLIEKEPDILPGVDRDIVLPLEQGLKKVIRNIHTNSHIEQVKNRENSVEITLNTDTKRRQENFSSLIVAVNRSPNVDDLDLNSTKISCDNNGFIKTDDQQRTTDPKIFAVGDITGGSMLAHLATRQGKVAADVICGHNSSVDLLAIPKIVYTKPQIGWCGLTEEQAICDNIEIVIKKRQWQDSARALTMGQSQGLTKLIIDPSTGRLLGAGITGHNVESLINEASLAIEMGALVEDIALTLHPSPSLGETIMEAAELFVSSPVQSVTTDKQPDE